MNLGLLLGWGANVYGAGTLKVGLRFLTLVFPIFIYRHCYQDRGVFPEAMADDMVLSDDRKIETRAGVLPYLALVAGAIIIFIAHKIAIYGTGDWLCRAIKPGHLKTSKRIAPR